jgi:hypothetical protein
MNRRNFLLSTALLPVAGLTMLLSKRDSSTRVEAYFDTGTIRYTHREVSQQFTVNTTWYGPESDYTYFSEETIERLCRTHRDALKASLSQTIGAGPAVVFRTTKIVPGLRYENRAYYPVWVEL